MPHFEKMLYDQAQLAAVLADMYGVTNNAQYEKVLDGVLLYVDRDLSHPVSVK